MMNFNHQYTPMNDLRRSFPTFTRNIAVSTGNNEKDYNNEYGLNPGKKLFKQGAFIPSIFGPKIIDRKIFASKYSANALVFERKDKMLAGGFIPVWRTRYYKTKWAYEWDMAQGGYKDMFYNGALGATGVLRSSVFFSGFTPGQKYYDKHVSFMPMISALAINPTIWENNNLYYNLKDEGLMYNKFNYNPQQDKSDFFGYPNLGHPNNHFNITPFEAIFCDNQTYEHIKMQKSVDNENINGDYLVYLRDFILNEVEAKTVYFQNKDMGINHGPNDNNFVYTAWYKAGNKIIVGKDVTPKTDPGPYIIEPTADITMYACNSITLKPGFYAKAGSTYHAFIRCDGCSGPTRPLYPPEQNSIAPVNPINDASQTKKDRGNTHKKVKVYPNPSNGNIIIVFPKLSGNYNIYNLQGQIIEKERVTTLRQQTHLSQGIYILKWSNSNKVQTRKIIVL